MSRNKFIQFWRYLVAKKFNPPGHRALREIPRVELSPVFEVALTDPMRIKEIGDIIAQIVLLGRSRRRSTVTKSEVQNAA